MVAWTAFMDQKLLLAVLSVVKLDSGAVARKWEEIYGSTGGENPSQRGITEHIIKLKKDLGISGSSSSGRKLSPAKSSPAKERKGPGAPAKRTGSDPNDVDKTSPSKRKRTVTPDEDDTENEAPTSARNADDEFSVSIKHEDVEEFAPVRQRYARQAKAARKQLVVDESTEESGMDEAETEIDEVEPLTPASSPPDQDPKMVGKQWAHEMKVPDNGSETVFEDIVVGGVTSLNE